MKTLHRRNPSALCRLVALYTHVYTYMLSGVGALKSHHGVAIPINPIIALDLRVKSWDLWARTPPEIHESVCCWQGPGQNSAVWLHGLTVRTLYSEPCDRKANSREAFQNAIGNAPASTLRALQLRQHECEAARCHGDHPNCTLLHGNQAN